MPLFYTNQKIEKDERVKVERATSNKTLERDDVEQLTRAKFDQEDNARAEKEANIKPEKAQPEQEAKEKAEREAAKPDFEIEANANAELDAKIKIEKKEVLKAITKPKIEGAPGVSLIS